MLIDKMSSSTARAQASFDIGPPAVAATMAVAAIALGLRGVDWPAQLYRIQLFRNHGFVGFDAAWYGGHYPLAYSALFPPLAATVGVSVVAVVSAATAAWAFHRLVTARFGSVAWVGSFVFAAGTVVQVAVGQLPFLLGVMFALLSLLALRRRPWLAVVAAVLCALTSAVAAAFLVLAVVAGAIVAEPRERRHLILVAGGAIVPVGVISALYHQGGPFPFRVANLAALIGACALAWIVLPREERALRVGTLLYGAAAVVVFVIPTPLGGMMTRLETMVGVPVLAAAAAVPLRRKLLALAALPLLAWQWSPAWGTVSNGQTDTSSHADYFAPMLAELGHLSTGPARVEIPFTRDHWEAAWVAPTVPLARGWYRQLDMLRDGLFYQAGALTPASYQAWLDENGVSYVALPDVPLDFSSQSEAALIGAGVPYLQPVWHDAHWRLWQVVGSPGLVSGPARITSLGPDQFTLTATGPAVVVVRVRYSGTWTIDGGGACLAPTPDGWTDVHIERPGTIQVVAGLLPRSRDAC